VQASDRSRVDGANAKKSSSVGMKFCVEKQNPACYNDDSVCEHPVAGITVRKSMLQAACETIKKTAVTAS
jgi:hypothetical protein